jgi:hypothetical protein
VDIHSITYKSNVLNRFAFRVNELREFGEASCPHSDAVLFIRRDLDQAFDRIATKLLKPLLNGWRDV